MDIISLIIQIVLVIIPLLFIGVGALMGRKLKWQFSLSKIAVIVVSALLSAVIAMLVSSAMLNALFDTITEAIGEEEITTLFDKVESVKEFICAVVAMIVAPIIYFVLFFIMRGILGLVNRLALTRLYIKNKEGEAPYDSTKARIHTSEKNPLGIVIGAVCGMFLFSAIALAPISTLSVVGSAAVNVSEAIEDQEVGAVIGDVSKALKTNTSSVIVTVTGGRAVYGMMTTYTVADERVSFAKETKFISEAANTALTVSNEKFANDQKAQSIRDFSLSFEKSEVFPILIADVISAASEEWDDGNEFLGIESPTNEDGLEGILMDCITDTTRETVKEDVHSLTEILAIVIENDYMESLEDDAMALVENEGVTSQILLICIENERWYPVIDGLADYGATQVLSNFGVFDSKEDAYDAFIDEVEALANSRSVDEDIKSKLGTKIENYGLTVENEVLESASFVNKPSAYMLQWVYANVVSSAEDFAKKTTLVTIDDITTGSASLQNPQKEAKNLAHMLSVAVSTVDEMESLNGSSKLLKVIGPTLDAMSSTETFGPQKTGVLLTSIFQTEKVRKDIGFSYKQATDTCHTIVDGAGKKGYTQMMNSLGNMVEVIEKASNSNDIKEQVDELMKDLTPESAAVIGTATTPETVKNYGVPEQSAEPVSGLVSDMFVSLGDAKDNGMSDEEYEKESQAVTHVMNVMMSANNNSDNAKSVFGEDSATGVEADAFIDDVLSSDVVSGSVLDSVYGDSDEPVVDPLKLDKQLSEDETNDVVEALNNQWLNASAEKKQDGTFEKKIIAIGAIVNLNIVVSDSGVVVG